MAELHVADLGFVGLFGGAHRVARHAAAHVLIAGRDRHDSGLLLLVAARHGELAQHVVFHERQEFVVVLVLVLMRVDVDDENVVEAAPVRLLARVPQESRGVEFLDTDAAAAVRDQVHLMIFLESADTTLSLPPSGGEKRKPLSRSMCSTSGDAAFCFLPLKGGGLRWGSRAARSVSFFKNRRLPPRPALPEAELEGGEV